MPGVKQVVGPGDIKGVVTDFGLEGSVVEKTVGEDMQEGMVFRGNGDGVVDYKAYSSSAVNQMQGGVEMKQKVGVHWFEIFPRNANQEQVINLVRV